MAFPSLAIQRCGGDFNQRSFSCTSAIGPQRTFQQNRCPLSGLSGHDDCIAKCPLITQSGLWHRSGIGPGLLQVTDFCAYNSVTLATDGEPIRVGQAASFSQTEKPMSG